MPGYAHRYVDVGTLLRRGLAVVLLCVALPVVAATANPSEPAAIAALRADQSRTAAQLEAEASRLRAGSQDPKFRAWATLAEAEAANDQEHAEAALAGLDQAIAQADALKLPDLRFEALIRLSTILVNRGRSKETEAVLKQMQAMVEAGDNPRWRAQWLHERGVLERKQGRFEEARSLFLQARSLFHATGDAVAEARELNSIGNLDGRTGRFSDAVAMHGDALAMARKAGDKAETARSLRMLGVLYRNLDDEELASRYLLEALSYVEERNRREAIALHGELIGAFTRLEKLPEAEHHGQQAVRLAELSGSHPNKVNAFTRVAELRLLQGRIDEAEQWVERANASYDHVAVRDKTLVRISRLRVLAARNNTAQALKEADVVLWNAHPLSVYEVEEVFARALGKSFVYTPVPLALAKLIFAPSPVQKLFGMPSQSLDYFDHPVHYDASEATADLATLGVRCPRFGDYAQRLVAFYKSKKEGQVRREAMI